MSPDRTSRELLPDPVIQVLDEYRRNFGLDLGLWLPREGGDPFRLYPGSGRNSSPSPGSTLLEVPTRSGADLILEIASSGAPADEGRSAAANTLRTTLEQLYQYAEEVRYFTLEVSERYEEINLLYSISETLGSLMHLKDATNLILAEVCDVMGARRGSLWVHRPEEDRLHLVASVGEGGRVGPLPAGDTSAVTAQVFREGRSLILSSYPGAPAQDQHPPGPGGADRSATDRNPRKESSRGASSSDDVAGESVLSVPIRYTPPEDDARTVGVINLIGRRRGGRFSASDQKLLSAIASQVGAALENNRLIQESLQRERVSREMELAHNLQMKLLPSLDAFDGSEVAARVRPADSVGGDFYHLLRLSGGRFGVMIGDVSSHGFPAALIMALTLSAATIYAAEMSSPASVMTEMGRALRDELESTEMYISLFYAVVDPARGELVYANAGHPHAFLLGREGEAPERLPALDPPMGIVGATEYRERVVPWTSSRDLLLLFTDGLSDDLVVGSRRAGEDRILEEVERLRSREAREIVDALFDLMAEEGAPEATPDDRTAVVLKV